MLRSEGSRESRNGHKIRPGAIASTPVNAPLHEYPADAIKQALLAAHTPSTALDELIATAEAVFALIYHSEIDLDLKNAFGQLEKEFEVYKVLLGLEQAPD